MITTLWIQVDVSQELFNILQTPTLIIYGTEDKTIGLVANGNLRNMPNSEIYPLEKAKHPAYLDKPDEWHFLLYNFLLAVDREAV
jgi:pimeloyl-ACP methyl ester carboxylesterase